MRGAVALLVLGACGRVAFDPLASGDAGDGGRDGGDAPVDAAPCNGPFQAAVELTELDTPQDEDGPSMSDDQLEIVFSSTRPGGQGGYDLYTAHRARKSDAFSAPVAIVQLDSNADEDDAFLDADGVTLWYNDGLQIFRSVRADRSSPWQAPTVVSELDSAAADDAPSFSPDGLVMYFSSARSPTVGGTGLHDLWRARRPSRTAPFGTPVQETVASSNSFDCCPQVLAGGTQVAFASQRNGPTEVWVAPRAADDSLGPAMKLPLVDSPDPYVAFDPFTTPDGEVFGVISNRPGGQGGDDIWLYERSCP